MTRYGYTGESAPRWLPVSLFEGWNDRRFFRRHERLYRRPVWKRCLHWLGFCLAVLRDAAKRGRGRRA